MWQTPPIVANRQCASHRWKEQLTPAEIGHVLGISPVAAERLLFRALGELRKILRVSV